MAETVSGKIELEMVTKGGDEQGAEGVEAKAGGKGKKDDPRLGVLESK